MRVEKENIFKVEQGLKIGMGSIGVESEGLDIGRGAISGRFGIYRGYKQYMAYIA